MIKLPNLAEICGFKAAAENQRQAEVEQQIKVDGKLVGKAGTQSYEKFGCFECDGNNLDCGSHYPVPKPEIDVNFGQ